MLLKLGNAAAANVESGKYSRGPNLLVSAPLHGSDSFIVLVFSQVKGKVSGTIGIKAWNCSCWLPATVEIGK